MAAILKHQSDRADIIKVEWSHATDKTNTHRSSQYHQYGSMNASEPVNRTRQKFNMLALNVNGLVPKTAELT